MNITQSIHGVLKVRAVRFHPSNANSVSIDIETENGELSQTLYFGHSAHSFGQACAMFYALGGSPEKIVGPDSDVLGDG